MFEISYLTARFGPLEALKEISVSFSEREITAILGHNGAGKTTLLRCAVGDHLDVSGKVTFNGKTIIPGETHRNVRLGIGFVPQDNNVFGELVVEQNLQIAGLRFDASYIEKVYELFPILKQRRLQLAKSLSGGERQMLALGMALMTRPTVLFLDEPTSGLAPVIVMNVLNTLKKINEDMSASVIIVEQNVQAVLSVVKRGIILKMGRVIFDGPALEISSHKELFALF